MKKSEANLVFKSLCEMHSWMGSFKSRVNELKFQSAVRGKALNPFDNRKDYEICLNIFSDLFLK